ncbi:DUF2637 domain-containing protein [Streptomyces sp. NPDC000075]|uniref:DUF2637 domain-containing protein n=1 Tax=Streptomyces sp. NPDC000075 TaxID=3154241 RepID=UPI0031DECF17
MSVGAGALVIAGIGFAGSYSAVVGLARDKGFGDFAEVFPIGIDAGIGVLLALDLLLSWIRIPFPVLRHIAWLLTAATIAFNAAAARPDPIAVGMHAAMPVLFVVVVEAVRHAVGRLADITADRHMDGVRFWRWVLSPLPTMKLWRRMKLWELRSYEQAVGMEQDRLIYQARLQARYGWAWRRKAPVEAVMPLRLAKLGVPLTQTAPAGLAAAGIEFEWRPAPQPAPVEIPVVPALEDHIEKALAVVGTVAAPGRVPVFAEDKPKRPEVTVRVPEVVTPEPEETGQAEEGQAEDDTPEDESDDATEQDKPGAASGDESTKPPVESAGPIPRMEETPPPPEEPKPDRQTDALTAANARRKAEAETRRRDLVTAWQTALVERPDLTKAEYAAEHGISPRTLSRALAHA